MNAPTIPTDRQNLTDEQLDTLLFALYGVWRNNGHDVRDALAMIAVRHCDADVRKVAFDEYGQVTGRRIVEDAYNMRLRVMVDAENRAVCSERVCR